MSLPCTALLATALALALPATVAAQGIDMSRGGPITVDARDGFEWRQNEQVIIASGDARAVRGTTTILADRLYAYYRKKAHPAGAPPPPPPKPGTPQSDTEGGNEIYRLLAEGHVRILTPTDEATGEHGIYDIDQAVAVLTGNNLRLTTPDQLITARDSMEYWSDKHMSVARGNAVVITSDARRLAGDVIVGYSEPDDQDRAKQAAQPASTGSSGGMPEGSGRLKRIEAYGNVEVRTATDIVRGGRGVYLTDSRLARVVDNVRITHGETQMSGAAADVNMDTGIAHLVALPGRRVQGLIMPGDKPAEGGKPGQPAPLAPGKKP